MKPKYAAIIKSQEDSFPVHRRHQNYPKHSKKKKKKKKKEEKKKKINRITYPLLIA